MSFPLKLFTVNWKARFAFFSLFSGKIEDLSWTKCKYEPHLLSFHSQHGDILDEILD